MNRKCVGPQNVLTVLCDPITKAFWTPSPFDWALILCSYALLNIIESAWDHTRRRKQLRDPKFTE